MLAKPALKTNGDTPWHNVNRSRCHGDAMICYKTLTIKQSAASTEGLPHPRPTNHLLWVINK